MWLRDAGLGTPSLQAAPSVKIEAPGAAVGGGGEGCVGRRGLAPRSRRRLPACVGARLPCPLTRGLFPIRLAPGVGGPRRGEAGLPGASPPTGPGPRGSLALTGTPVSARLLQVCLSRFPLFFAQHRPAGPWKAPNLSSISQGRTSGTDFLGKKMEGAAGVTSSRGVLWPGRSARYL